MSAAVTRIRIPVQPNTVPSPTSFQRPELRRATTLSTEVTYLKGAGPAVAAKLRALEILQVRDLLFHLPKDHRDLRMLRSAVFSVPLT